MPLDGGGKFPPSLSFACLRGQAPAKNCQHCPDGPSNEAIQSGAAERLYVSEERYDIKKQSDAQKCNREVNEDRMQLDAPVELV
jgi:hypothetical protein